MNNHEELLQQLPAILREPAQLFDHKYRQDVFLLSALTMLSGLLPNYSGMYAGRRIYPNLHSFIITHGEQHLLPTLTARHISDKVQDEWIACNEQYAKDYPAHMALYKQELKVYKKGKTWMCPEQPHQYENYKIYIPDDMSASAMMQQLKENSGTGTILADDPYDFRNVLRLDNGKLKELLYLSYHNKGYDRSAPGKDMQVSKLALSVLLSGDEEQLLQLVQGIHTGIHEQFIFYRIPEDAPPADPFEHIDTKDIMARLTDRIVDINTEQVFADKDTPFSMTEEQEQRFREQQFSQQQAICCYRIIMILSMLRLGEDQPKRRITSVTATDTDVACGIMITACYEEHNRETGQYIQKHDIQRSAAEGDTEEHTLIYQLYGQGISLRKIAIEVYNDEGKHMKVQRLLKRKGLL